jgi:hypothetical protein
MKRDLRLRLALGNERPGYTPRRVVSMGSIPRPGRCCLGGALGDRGQAAFRRGAHNRMFFERGVVDLLPRPAP